jgi:hypothetical protein
LGNGSGSSDVLTARVHPAALLSVPQRRVAHALRVAARAARAKAAEAGERCAHVGAG